MPDLRGTALDRTSETELPAEAGLRPPRALTVAITGSCNLDCLHCLVDAGTKANESHVAAETVRRIIRDFAALGGEEIHLTGGEPLRHPQGLDLLASCREQPFAIVGLQTNGALLGHAQVDALRALRFEGLSIQVSLDGASPPTHDRVRGRGSFVGTIHGLRRLAAAGLGRNVTIAFTEMRHNLDDVAALLDLVEALGLRRLVSGTLVKDGRAASGAVAPPAPEQVRDLVARYHSDARFHAQYDEYGSIAAIEWWKGRLAAGPDCCSFVEHPYLTAGGTLYPCALLRADEFAVHGVLEKPLAAALREGTPLWSRLSALEARRHGRLAPCQDCPGLLHCAGGCMGRAHAASGELMVVEDRCELRKAVYGWRPSP